MTCECMTVELTGSVNNKGIVEIPQDATVRDLVYCIGGGINGHREFKAVQLEGPSCICLINSNYLDLIFDNEFLKEIGFIGRLKSITVLDDSACMVDVARSCMGSIIQGLCGKCIPCREGTKRILEILERITSGGGKGEDIDVLNDLACVIAETSLCRMGKISVNPVESTLKYFRDEYIAHIIQKKCPAGLCEMGGNNRKNGVLRMKDGTLAYGTNIA